MARHLERELDRLKRRLLELSTLVEATLNRAVSAVTRRDLKLAQEIVASDNIVDQAEVEIEEECLKLLALHQPVAIDLRLIVGILKLNNDLERIADLAVNIASRAMSLARIPAITHGFDFTEMSSRVKQMLNQSLAALVNLDVALARAVCLADREVDQINKEVYRQLHDRIREHPQDLEGLICHLSVSRNLERIADHATNIAEDVIYMVEGEIVRHRPIDTNNARQAAVQDSGPTN